MALKNNMDKVLNFIKNNIIIIIYSLIELVICILLLLNIVNKEYILDYSLIIINFIMSVIIFVLFKNKFNMYIMLGMFFTCLADYNLIVLGENREIGVLFFTFAQISYMFALRINKKELLIRLIIITVLEVASLIICKDLYSFLVFITMMYLGLFIANIIFGFIKKNNIIFLIGMISYLLCDICVGVSGFELFDGTQTAVILGNLIYYFYLPGLFLMIIGTYIKSKKEKLCKNI